MAHATRTGINTGQHYDYAGLPEQTFGWMSRAF